MADSAVIRKIILVFLSIVILLLGIKGYKALLRSGKKTTPIEMSPPQVEVTILTVEPRETPTYLSGYGTVRGKREVLIIPEVEGKITSISPNFKSGKTVKKHEPLFTVDTRAIKIRIEQIKGEIAKLLAQIDTTRQEAENIKRNLEIVKENVRLTEKELKRKELLLQKSMISEQQTDSARLQYLQERNSKTNYENELAMIPLKISELRAALRVKKAELADTRLKLDKSTLRAPFDGIIFDKSVEIAQVIKTGQTVATLVDISAWEIPVDLDEKNIEHLPFEKFNNTPPWKYPCTIFWDAQKDTVQWTGYVSRIEKINEQTRTVRVVVEVPNNPSAVMKLARGMFCQVTIPGKKHKDVISIPSAALHNNNMVYVSEKGRLRIKQVKVLQQLEGTIIIRSGLSTGDKVIISSLNNPVEGMALKERYSKNKN